jgi:hypothetical protein
LSVLGTASSSMRATRTGKRLRDCLSVVGALSLRVIFAKGEIVPRSISYSDTYIARSSLLFALQNKLSKNTKALHSRERLFVTYF